MEHIYLTGLLLFVLFLLLGGGVWIGLSLLGVALFAMELFTTRPAGDAMITTIWTSSSSWTLTALPLFIWMGEILFRTRLSEDMFRGLAPWMSGLPGRPPPHQRRGLRHLRRDQRLLGRHLRHHRQDDHPRAAPPRLSRAFGRWLPWPAPARSGS